jgi:hypothetical protein
MAYSVKLFTDVSRAREDLYFTPAAPAGSARDAEPAEKRDMEERPFLP